MGCGFMKGYSPWNKGLKGVQVSCRKGIKGSVVANVTSFTKGHIPWNTGLKGVQVGWSRGLTIEKCLLEGLE